MVNAGDRCSSRSPSTSSRLRSQSFLLRFMSYEGRGGRARQGKEASASCRGSWALPMANCTGWDLSGKGVGSPLAMPRDH